MTAMKNSCATIPPQDRPTRWTASTAAPSSSPARASAQSAVENSSGGSGDSPAPGASQAMTVKSEPSAASCGRHMRESTAQRKPWRSTSAGPVQPVGRRLCVYRPQRVAWPPPRECAVRAIRCVADFGYDRPSTETGGRSWYSLPRTTSSNVTRTCHPARTHRAGCASCLRTPRRPKRARAPDPRCRTRRPGSSRLEKTKLWENGHWIALDVGPDHAHDPISGRRFVWKSAARMCMASRSLLSSSYGPNDARTGCGNVALEPSARVNQVDRPSSATATAAATTAVARASPRRRWRTSEWSRRIEPLTYALPARCSPAELRPRRAEFSGGMLPSGGGGDLDRGHVRPELLEL